MNLHEKIGEIHKRVLETHPSILRISAAIYDEETDMLRTFVNSTIGGSPLNYYSSKLSNSLSLSKMAKTNVPRIIDDLMELSSISRTHTEAIRKGGFHSSLTYSIMYHDRFFGFIFFNSDQTSYFKEDIVKELSVYYELISLMVVAEMLPIEIFKGAAATAREFSRLKDEETGAHIVRMSHYARIIALEVAIDYGLSDEDIEYIFRLSPLHDIGKVGIPDSILLKKGKLTEEEFETMKTHVSIGAEMVDTMIREFHLATMNHIEILRNIVAYHHEAVDGSGYLKGMKGSEIPIEARITTIADVFDALTSSRPYKEAWSNEEAFSYLLDQSGKKFDAACVNALLKNQDQIEAIQSQFKEDAFG
jgi:HD-GYP domain-containing protein (c-di-GMP phosphodiesterase class II)